MLPASGHHLTFASVLCPVDFSAHSQVALRYAAALAARSRGRLHVLFVNDPLLVAAAAAAYSTQSLGEASVEELQRFVRATLTPSRFTAVQPHFETALGQPAPEILRAVARLSPDLVVIGTKGLNAAHRLLLGSTTTAVLRKTRVPVLAVPPMAGESDASDVPADWPGRELIAPLELGSHAAADLTRAAELARAFGVSLVIVHTVPLPVAPAWLHADVDAHTRIRAAKAATALERLRASLPDVATETVVRIGHPPDEIAALAAERRAGLIVMTLRGHGGLFGDPVGAFSYHVLCHAVAPVLALPVQRSSARRSDPAPGGNLDSRPVV